MDLVMRMKDTVLGFMWPVPVAPGKERKTKSSAKCAGLC